MATKYWNGSAWVDPKMKIWDGSQWSDVGGGGGIKNVQHLTHSFSNTTSTLAINTVDLNKAIVTISGGAQSSKVENSMVKVTFQDDHTLYLEKKSSSSNIYLAIQVIEFEGVKSLQRGTKGWSSNSEQVIAVNSVNVNKSMLFVSWKMGSTDNQTYYGWLEYYIKSSTQIALKNIFNTATKYCSWQLIEFN